MASLCENGPTVGRILFAPSVCTQSFNSGKLLCSLYGTDTIVTSISTTLRRLSINFGSGKDEGVEDDDDADDDEDAHGNVCCCFLDNEDEVLLLLL